MTDLVTTFKAAKLAGVSRGEFQKRILSGELNTFEGKIRLKDLIKVFPDISRHEDPVIKRMEEIKSSACSGIEKYNRSSLPKASCLMEKLEKLSDAFLSRHNQALRQEQVILDTLHRIENLTEEEDADYRSRLEEIASWLSRELEKK